jgi:adenine-specific DNA methylase
MTNKFFLTFFLSLTIFATTSVLSNAEDAISLNLPESVISKATKAVLPLTIDAHSKTIKGDIIIINISNLRLTKGHLACRLQLAGNNLTFVTEIAGHEINLKIGSVQLELDTNAAIRFDQKQQMLFLKPLLQDISKKQNTSNANISQALIAILNGREFPIRMQNIEPLIAKTGTKTLTINTRITDIKANQGFLQLKLLPTITAK